LKVLTRRYWVEDDKVYAGLDEYIDIPFPIMCRVKCWLDFKRITLIKIPLFRLKLWFYPSKKKEPFFNNFEPRRKDYAK